MLTQVSLAVAYGGSLEINPRSFQLMISLYMEGEELTIQDLINVESTWWHFFVIGLRLHKLRAPCHSLWLCAALC